MPGSKSDVIKNADNEIKEILQKNIRNIRKEKKITQQMLSEALGIKRETYSNYECRTLPPQYLILRLAKIYNVTPDVFYRIDLDPSAIFVANTNSEVYGERYFIDLTDSEKLLLMKFRQLNSSDQQELSDYISKKLEDK